MPNAVYITVAVVAIAAIAIYFLRRDSRKRGEEEVKRENAEHDTEVAKKRLEIANSPPDSDDDVLAWLRGDNKK